MLLHGFSSAATWPNDGNMTSGQTPSRLSYGTSRMCLWPMHALLELLPILTKLELVFMRSPELNKAPSQHLMKIDKGLVDYAFCRRAEPNSIATTHRAHGENHTYIRSICISQRTTPKQHAVNATLSGIWADHTAIASASLIKKSRQFPIGCCLS